MKNYYDTFVGFCLQLCTKHDYKSALKVKRHNRALTKIDKLIEEINNADCSKVFGELLNHDNENVKLGAASACLQSNIFVDKAVDTLKKLSETTEDWSISFSAKMVLEQFEKNNKMSTKETNK